MVSGAIRDTSNNGQPLFGRPPASGSCDIEVDCHQAQLLSRISHIYREKRFTRGVAVMSSTNYAILIGHVGTTIDQIATKSGRFITRFDVFTYEISEGEEHKTRHTVICRGALADKVREELEINRRVKVEGRIEYRTFRRKDMPDKFTADIVAQSVEFL